MLFSSTKIIKGYFNVCIQNTNQNKFLNYPLNKYIKFKDTIEFFSYLCENRFACSDERYFFKDNTNKFSFQFPYHFQCLIIEAEAEISELEKLLSNKILLHSIGIKSKVSIKWMKKLAMVVSNTCVNNIDFIDDYKKTEKKEIQNIFKSCYCSYSSIEENNSIIFINNELFYLEALEYNPYFNSKLLLKKNGIIYDSVSNGSNFSEEKLFKRKEIWNTSKKRIDICKDCEFRFMCLDKRVPIKRNAEEWFYNSECNYNPYIAKWNGEEGYKTLEECGVKSDQYGLHINHKKIAAINKEIWEC